MAGGSPLAHSRMGLLAFALALWSAYVPARSAGHGPFAVAVTPSEFVPTTIMYRGATVFGTGKPIVVRFVHSTADWGNQLFFMDPRTGGEKPLILYRGSGLGNKCPDSGSMQANLGIYDSTEEAVFMLRSVSSDFAGQYCTGEACGPRYTGLNDPILSRFHSRGEFGHMAGHIWAEANRITKEQADSLGPPCPGRPRSPGEEGILFSFNDGANGTFGDLVILVTGVYMDVERDGLPRLPADTVVVPGPIPARCGIEAVAGGVARGEPFMPQPMERPVSAILPRPSPRHPRIFMDQAWRREDGHRPDETHFPNGPDIEVTTPGPFEFNLGFFTTQGEFVNRARGVVTAEMLGSIGAGKDGRRSISLMWYPVSEKGNIASTGSFVVRGWLRTIPNALPSEPGHASASCPEDRANLLSTFGFIRR
ncbi:MAG: hypothetical protein JWP91_1546 [Fibrobacteres bacterium]|nr:hypothetical protein [Fibrobacterota bacterium]